MLVIASSSRIDANLALSLYDKDPVEKNLFYMEFEHAKVDSEEKSVPCYAIIPHELVSIINGASIILIMGYKLEQEESDHEHYLLFKAVQDKMGSSTLSVIADNEIMIDSGHEHTLEVDIAQSWKLSWAKGQPPILKNGAKKLICGKDIPAEYEGTPAQCYRWTIPYVKFQPAIQSCFRFEE